MKANNSMLWWQSGVFYNLYVRSYRDTDGDGIGDLPGVIEKLDYLKALGVDVVWLSGALDSPWREFGFDVRDLKNMHPQLGGMQAFDRLLEEAHRREMQVIIDFIPNHTSSDHAWFQESRSSRESPKRDWYLWSDPRPDGSPPNNWTSLFGGSAWEWDEATGQFYMHTFLRGQPDLNWRSPQVRAAMKDVLSFWLERGVDGFRVDAAHHIIKDAHLRDNPVNPSPRVIDGRTLAHEAQLHLYDREQFELFQVYSELREVLDEWSEKTGRPRAWVAEVHPAGWGAWVQYYKAFHFPFNNGFIFTEWKSLYVRILTDTIEAMMPPGAWPNAHTGNFDEWRMVTRVGKEQARVAAMLLMTLRGSPLLYYGEEIGMHNVEVPEALAQDRMGLQTGLSRDPQRTPMQWNAGDNAGFSDTPGVQPWLPVAEDAAENNVQVLWEDQRSILNLYRSLIACRRASPALLSGSYRPVEVAQWGEVFAFLREDLSAGERLLVALNFSDQMINLSLPALGRGSVMISTHLDREGEANLASFTLRPDEGVVVRLEEEP